MRPSSALLVCIVPLAWGSGSLPQRPADLTEMSIEELAAMQITSVAKKAQKLSRAAAAVYVITREEIRRSGATSIPELLRRVPGVQVARVDAHRWVVTARGFAGQFSNKLLVLIDGRSVYTTQFSGVHWDERDTLLEDIERIEVIRGPGVAVWGANAVNGVINIITRSAVETQGTLLAGGAGQQERGSAAVRHGFRAGQALHARVFGRWFSRGALSYPSGRGAQDDWSMSRGGFRLDWRVNGRDALMLEGDLYRGATNDLLGLGSLTPPFSLSTLDHAELSGGSLLGRWQRRFSENSDLALLFYYDESHRNEAPSRQASHIANLDVQQRWRRGRHELTAGLGERVTRDGLDGSFTIARTPAARTDPLFNTFVQDEITLVEDRLALTVGSKLEHNNYTGIEIEPNVRLMWTPTTRQGVWGAVSRGVRTPSRSDCCIRLNVAAFPGAQGLTLVSLFGTAGVQSERLLAYEAGYRFLPARRFSLDVAGFYNSYSKVLSQEAGEPFFESVPAPPHLVIPTQFMNGISGSAQGLEIATKWQAASRWRLDVDYAWLRLHLRQGGRSQSNAETLENSSPKHQARLESYLDLPGGLEFNAGLHYVDALPFHRIPRHLHTDIRISWRLRRGLEFMVSGEDLTGGRHAEFWSPSTGMPEPVEVGRNVQVKLTWRFD